MRTRINRFVALATGISRRSADKLIEDGNITVNNKVARLGEFVTESDEVRLNGEIVTAPSHTRTIILNKPPGYVCSRQGQGSRTIYDLLPEEYKKLKSIGRLDKESSGLLLLTDDGDLAYRLSHPSQVKTKVYLVELDKPLGDEDRYKVSVSGVELEDGNSRLKLKPRGPGPKEWRVEMHEGRNRQIRRTFKNIGFDVVKLHRISFGDYELGRLEEGKYHEL